MHSTNTLILLTLVFYLCVLEVCQCYVNVAFNKPAYQHYPLKLNDSTGDASNAVDGQKTDLSKDGGQCVVSAGKETATWWVNLTSIHSIHNITVYYMTGNKTWGPKNFNTGSFLGFSVYVSNTTDILHGTLCFKDTNFTLETIPAVFTAVCPVHGQYVIYYNKRFLDVSYADNYSHLAQNNVCEVEVYGCPATGCYGSNNSLPCPDVNCQYCHKETGTCQVCKPGYKGQQCELACEQTFYGVNCSQKCSTKCSSHACHPVTGNCVDSLTTSAKFEILGPIPFALINVGVLSFILLLFGCNFYIIWIRKKKRYYKEKDKSQSVPTTMSDASKNDENIELEDYKGKSEKIIKHEDEEIDIDGKIHMENPYGDICINTESVKDISISNLWSVIMENSKNENDGFKKEYATLLYGEKHPCEIGKHPENISKNRFKTTFPYDHSRIVLENQALDYINANFIDGLRQKDEYIATQGPKPSTVDDFWLMIWQENVVQIVMLTNLKEGTRKECAKYWPDLNEVKDCDVFIINTLEEKQYADYVIRKIQMTNKQENQTRTITQYHYIAWPDHGVPDPLCLLWFHDHVTRTKTYSHKGPTLVHCSAGIGRTGTYIAIDALYIEVKQDNKINIAEYVEKMREKRTNMVQTYEQYKTIFLTLYEMSMAPVTVQKPTEFIEQLKTKKLDTPANVSYLRDEFQKLMSVRHQRRDDNDKMVSEGEGLSTTIRPRYENVIIQNSSVPNRGSNIDGIFIHSFTNQNAFIVTHCQPADDVADFLRLITEYDSEVVVFMDPLDRIESRDTWMPTTSTSSKSFPPFIIQLQQENTKENEWHKVQITKEDTDFIPRMVHFAAPTHDLTSDYAQTVSQILGLVSFAQNMMGEGPIIVVSKDGDALCGVFCAVYNLIQQLTMDEEIDVFSVVRLLQTRRPELCATMEEYEMINHAMMTFIQLRTDENTYYNE